MSETRTETVSESVDTRNLLRWLLGITRPVHGPLFVSLGCRIIGLSLDIALFATAAGAVMHLVVDNGPAQGWFIALVVLAIAKAASGERAWLGVLASRLLKLPIASL